MSSLCSIKHRKKVLICGNNSLLDDVVCVRAMWNSVKVTSRYVPIVTFCSRGMCEVGQYAWISKLMVAWIDEWTNRRKVSWMSKLIYVYNYLDSWRSNTLKTAVSFINLYKERGSSILESLFRQIHSLFQSEGRSSAPLSVSSILSFLKANQ